MRIFGLLLPAYWKGTTVRIADPASARGKEAELLFRHLDAKEQYKRSVYVSPKRGATGRIVSLMKYKSPEGSPFIYYGVLVKDVLYALEESRLAKV
ncbi:hypothetical protein [Cohnella fermenti]|uniref:Uncharacterized protein n=1 Tax=Cohnella fermenti TaxID=2565925 RepID=A0A4S4BJN0_9BACL|nr:hypothetical protein [Cohnella fermenti]THF73912.1 hypothetical protein E6C55_26955 [Cohnella fermenti]